MKILYFEQDKDPEVRNIKRDLAVEQKLVGGHIEVYPVNEKILIVCDEEGWNKGLPINRAVVDWDGIAHEYIRGNFFVCGAGEEDFKSLTDRQVDRILRYSKKYQKEFPGWLN